MTRHGEARPRTVTFAMLADLCLALIAAASAAAVASRVGGTIGVLLLGVMGALAFGYAVTVWGLLRREAWARHLQIGLAALLVVGPPSSLFFLADASLTVRLALIAVHEAVAIALVAAMLGGPARAWLAPRPA